MGWDGFTNFVILWNGGVFAAQLADRRKATCVNRMVAFRFCQTGKSMVLLRLVTKQERGYTERDPRRR